MLSGRVNVLVALAMTGLAGCGSHELGAFENDQLSSVAWRLTSTSESLLNLEVGRSSCTRYMFLHVQESATEVRIMALATQTSAKCKPLKAQAVATSLRAPLGRRALVHDSVDLMLGVAASLGPDAR